ncbi:hypothetical protein [Legionella oakridgensis]|uniref:Integral membrane protein n=2 Tax=Legionella oakridgensis TaxID=29423 RepID=W0B5U5_9GAMM|nr:hypothetical protein [Legionella oakridgensis]AHE65883.1 hypothetical protein Loa_00294 [Legionella oakridgensis ATCC 33761 = DSM 21215]KTD39042.1 hypothetical protein Loak_1163 [Legionella oakridgensis]STY15816.1 Uncharacterised protein [Legionella longbeachae]
MKRMTVLAFLAIFSAELSAKNCGQFMGKKIVTSAGITCAEAKRVYRYFSKGKTAPGWTCGLSAGACSKGSQGFTFLFN